METSLSRVSSVTSCYRDKLDVETKTARDTADEDGDMPGDPAAAAAGADTNNRGANKPVPGNVSQEQHRASGPVSGGRQGEGGHDGGHDGGGNYTCEESVLEWRYPFKSPNMQMFNQLKASNGACTSQCPNLSQSAFSRRLRH